MNTANRVFAAKTSARWTSARWFIGAFLVLLLLLFSALPAQAQSQSEEEDDANRTATIPEECVRPEPPDEDDLSDVSRNLEANQAYEDCLKRTGGEGSEGDGNGGGDGGGNNAPNADDTSELNPAAVNRNATQPEECVEPEAPDDGTDPDEYAEAQQAYDDCLLRTGEDSGGQENGGSGDGGGGGDSECTAPDADAPADEMREYEECLEANGEMANDDTVPGESAGGDGGDGGDGGGEGGLNGMMLGGFKHIMSTIWDWTFGWALENMAEAFQTNLLSLPDLEQQGDLLSAYKSSVETLRPAILVGILILGILMMVRSDNYDLAYAGFQGLPRLMGVALALAFLPQFMGELSRITSGIGAAFFPGGQDVSAAGAELYKAAVGNLAVTNFLNLILFLGAGYVSIMLFIVALLNKILYSLLFVSGAFALTASIVPSLNSLAGSWFRGVLASAAIPALWSIEMGIGTVVVTSPESIFGGMANSVGFISESAVTSIGAIITMWVMYKTPFKCIEWAFNVQLPGRGGLTSLAKTGAALAVAIPAKTAIAHATKSLLNRSSGSGGIVVASKTGKDGKAAISGKQGAGGSAGAKARQIQQIGNQGNRTRVTENITKAHDKYSRQRDRTQEGKERFMQKDGSRGSNNTGMGRQSGSRSGTKV
ncbi:MAG: hypothetical protein WA982_17985 [Rubrobacteraceae bacterium]